MNNRIKRLPCILAVTGLLLLGATTARADVVLQWDEIAVRTLTTQVPTSPFFQARFAAIVQLAVFEAVNSITGDYESYLGSAAAPDGLTISASAGSSVEAAAIAAAHAVLVNYFPAIAAQLNAERDASLAAIPNGTAKTNGIATGLAAAAAVIALRVGDGSSPMTRYVPAPPLNPGEWDITPDGGCPTFGIPGGILFNWQDVRPFGFAPSSAGSWYEPFRPAPPPELTSNEYAKDFNEVKTVGAAASTARPDDRAIVARFYAVLSPTFLFHMAARQLAAARGDSLSENARNLALISIATNDAFIASFGTKYFYKLWRPYTAIRLADTDGNDKTEADPTWTNFITTPCFPSYPSNHASGSGAAAETLRRIYGAAGHSITLAATIPVIGFTTIQYTALKQITDDIDDARVYGGIHFRFDQIAGHDLGRAVATAVYKDNLRPIHPGA